jgi:hypothetical protein
MYGGYEMTTTEIYDQQTLNVRDMFMPEPCALCCVHRVACPDHGRPPAAEAEAMDIAGTGDFVGEDGDATERKARERDLELGDGEMKRGDDVTDTRMEENSLPFWNRALGPGKRTGGGGKSAAVRSSAVR